MKKVFILLSATFSAVFGQYATSIAYQGTGCTGKVLFMEQRALGVNETCTTFSCKNGNEENPFSTISSSWKVTCTSTFSNTISGFVDPYIQVSYFSSNTCSIGNKQINAYRTGTCWTSSNTSSFQYSCNNSVITYSEFSSSDCSGSKAEYPYNTNTCLSPYNVTGTCVTPSIDATSTSSIVTSTGLSTGVPTPLPTSTNSPQSSGSIIQINVVTVVFGIVYFMFLL
jgi:hypothetical protein